MNLKRILFLTISVIITSCSGDDYTDVSNENPGTSTDVSVLQDIFGQNIDLDNLLNYADQGIPNYITQDNTLENDITDAKATLGRVLFYDKNLSTDNTIACASCHQQAFAFSDQNDVSTGVNGVTGRHSMRLINARFARESRFFWDERANTLEEQTTQPIQDHAEMGFSGENGAPTLQDLLTKLEGLNYYQELFQSVYGNTTITETRLQESLAQFIRSIQSFDSKYDSGRATVQNDNQQFPNFTDLENTGKDLFFRPPNQNGAGCITCHAAPEFDIDPNSLNNGVIGVFGNATAIDITITRAPTLRDIFNDQGVLNGALMHDASLTSLTAVLEHYNDIDATGNANLDNRLKGGPAGNGQNLNLSAEDIEALEAFIKTLSGTNVYTDTKWSNPFID
ncbi:cytochrome-c peroxidase [Aquimarina sp. AD10]|uniref:cytochrome-c peroxidase n=1 Tax=Aquimarina sp. AD10 TaxID=1714849 RepID=UPI000E5214DD|nr:cytochrome c peroxidase [Aquimarina sp. AD10]AXT62740.1 cytochrome-c peroxidase [Aquimarina sp. AD10]RKN01923.1 cytochrome-c peroxidase [Aquimarina sp. AD10]